MESKILVALALIGLSAGAKLSNNYLPPKSAASAGGYGGLLQGPQTYPQPTNQYIPPVPAKQAPLYPGKSQYQRQPQGQLPGPYRQPANQGQQIAILRSENENNGDGNYKFAFETANGIRRQENGHLRNANSAHPEQVVMGSYSYTGDNGKLYTVHYTADSAGFQVQGDHLPTPPPVPYEIKKSLAVHHKTSQPHQQHSVPAAQSSGSVRGPNSQYLPPAQPGYSYNHPGARKYK